MQLKVEKMPKTSRELVRVFLQSGQVVMEVLDDEGTYRSTHTLYSSLYNYLRRNRERYPDVQVFYRKGHCYLRKTETASR